MELPNTLPMRIASGQTIQVPSVGFGTWAPENSSWCTEAVINALKCGYRHLDCAWEYGVDIEVGEAIRQSGVPRKDIFITTKFWPNFAAPQNVEVCLDQILHRMGLQYVDLLLAHFPGALQPDGDLATARNFMGASATEQRALTDESENYVPDLQHCPSAVAMLNGGKGSFVPTWQAMQAMVRSGKCRAVGVSNFEREHIEEILPHAAHADIPISCNQIEAHPWYPNSDLINFLQSEEILPTIYSPFAPKSFRLENGAVVGEPFKPHGVLLLQTPLVQEVATCNDMDAGQILQSWAVQRRTIPLAKSQSKARILSNLAVRKLSDDDMKALDSMSMSGCSGKCVDLNLLFPGLTMKEVICAR